MLLYEFQSPTITPQQLEELETYIDRLFSVSNLDIEFTKHFQRRLRDERNKPAITIYELQRMFKKVYRQMHKGKDLVDLGPDAEAVLKDMASNINVPFIIKWDQEDLEFDLVAKTIMRKSNFKTSNNILTVESLPWWEQKKTIKGKKVIISDVESLQLKEICEELVKQPDLFENTEEYKDLTEFLRKFGETPIIGKYYNYASLFAVIPGLIINLKHTDPYKLIRKTNDYYWFSVDGREKKWPEHGTISNNFLKYTLLFKSSNAKEQFITTLVLKFSDWNIKIIAL